MTEYDNEKRGVLFRNEDKKTEKHPDYSGSAQIEGVDYFLDAWINKSGKTSKKFLSIRFKPKSEAKSGGSAAADDDIPFHHEPHDVSEMRGHVTHW